MKKIFLTNLLFLFAGAQFCFAQFSGTVTDKVSGETLIRAAVLIDKSYQATVTNNSGEFSFNYPNSDSVTITVSYLGYETTKQTIFKDKKAAIKLTSRMVLNDEIVVKASRSEKNSGTTFSILTKQDIEKINTGRDIPMLLNDIPGTVVNSDAGAGIGYTGFRIRGTDPTRINVMVNGIPINDSESQATFFVNMPDLISSAQDVQVQRGVGTSTNGNAAFGASVNINTLQYNPLPYAETSVSAGSFNTLRNNLKIGSGLISEKFTFDGRISRIVSDGFIDRASSNLQSYYLSGNYYGKKNSLKLVHFSGNETTYQAWNGIPESRLRGNVNEMNNYVARNFLSNNDSAHLLNSSNRTYNMFTYRNQTDNYKQQHYQAHYSQKVNKQMIANVSLHYTKGAGYFEEYKPFETLSDYNVLPVVNGNDTVSQSNLVRRKWLDNDFYGLTYSLTYTDKKMQSILGGGANQYFGRHFGRVVWVENSNGFSPENNYYYNTSLKNDYNIFLKNTYNINEAFSVMLDLQYRGIDYSFIGLDTTFSNVKEKVNYQFFNPKAGVTYKINQNHFVYASACVAHREPTREDFINSTVVTRPMQERLIDYEAGWEITHYNFTLNTTLYYMQYKNQMVLSGKINDVGAYTRINVPNSYRRGIELNGAYTFNQYLSLRGNIAMSQNHILNFTEYIDNFDEGVQNEIVYNKTTIAFSPALVSSLAMLVKPYKGLELIWSHKFVGKQYLDNTGSDERMLDPFHFSDISIIYSPTIKSLKNIRFNATVFNVFNHEYEPNGYTFGYIVGGRRINENFYYPQAGINYLVGCTILF